MRIVYFNSFLRIFKKLPIQQQNNIGNAISGLVLCLEKKTQIPSCFDLKKLAKDFREIRIGLDLRILFTIEQDTINFVFVGSHDEIKRYLKT